MSLCEAKPGQPGLNQPKNKNQMKTKMMKTYDIYFHNSENSNNKGFRMTWSEVIRYIRTADRSESYWADYIGGVFQIVCNETKKVVFEATIKA